MDNMFLLAGIIAFVFFLAKFAEMRFIEKESKPLKFFIRDSLVVYVSSVVGIFLVGQLNSVVKETNISTPVAPQVFTDNPSF